MKAIYKAYHHIDLEVEGATLQDILQGISQIEAAIGYEVCGKCKREFVFPRHRKAEDNDFYELVCGDCGAVLQLGTNKEAKTLYKKKMATDSKGKALKDADGKGQYLPNNGWMKWNSATQKME
jgi:hypothetical protein